ncbi:Endoglucanase-4 [Drechslerella dactyloides]|uniref:AA9 family lytic polysaccharide monooxygenase n=1 Tax=Drechslerella dactyloides TaxID=74499 RepID=A0AAD6IVD6_DREDA|nr:Endoglucanase-4 [Drechslerella dactyloides]
MASGFGWEYSNGGLFQVEMLRLGLSLPVSVLAHQNLHQFWVNGVSPGYEVGIRMPPSNNPVTDVNSNDIACNVNGSNGANVAVVNANAGDTIQVQWDVSSHPGPIVHSLFGPVSSAKTATGIGAWFKIQELDYANNLWANQVLEANAGKFTFTLPRNLASGEYLLRSEMLALHGAQTLGGAQFYIGCMQLKITGPGGNCSPKYNLPGAYKAADNNIYIPDFYYGFVPSTYSAPGPAVATCVGGGGGQPTTLATTSPRTSTTTSRTTAAGTSSRTTTTSSRTSSRTTSAGGGGGGGAPLYGQCGGQGWTGPTTCASGTCTYSNAYYSQCL